jgi:hypothetical protein
MRKLLNNHNRNLILIVASVFLLVGILVLSEDTAPKREKINIDIPIKPTQIK